LLRLSTKFFPRRECFGANHNRAGKHETVIPAIPRFGFSGETGKTTQSLLGRAWMALELEPGALENVKGTVRYPEAFGI